MTEQDSLFGAPDEGWAAPTNATEKEEAPTSAKNGELAREWVEAHPTEAPAEEAELSDERLELQENLWVETPPPYVRPTMAEVLAVPTNGTRAVGSFSGCGGSSLGLRLAGIRVDYVIEFIPAAIETYKANQPDTFVDGRDIRQITAEEILERIGLERGELDLFEGSPPCASFTLAGKRDKLWGTVKKYSDTKQRTDDLFWEWRRLLDGLYPRAFVAENVPSMAMGKALDAYAWQVTKALSEVGYDVQAKVLNAANYGVPQTRKRLIFVGMRRDLGLRWEWPAPTTPTAHTTRQMLQAVPDADPDHGPFLQECAMYGTTNELRWNHLMEQRQRLRIGGVAGMYGRWVEDDMVRCVRCGEYLEKHEVVRRAAGGVIKEAKCDDGQAAVFPKNGLQFIVPDLDRPCCTVIADGWGRSGGSIVHPQQCRKLTPAECKSASGFPSDFVLTGKLKQRYERIGRAVPPPLYAAVGAQLVRTLKGAT